MIVDRFDVFHRADQIDRIEINHIWLIYLKIALI